jgi:hypothetical protein
VTNSSFNTTAYTNHQPLENRKYSNPIIISRENSLINVVRPSNIAGNILGSKINNVMQTSSTSSNSGNLSKQLQNQ